MANDKGPGFDDLLDRLLGHAWIVHEIHLLDSIALVHIAHGADEARDRPDSRIAATQRRAGRAHVEIRCLYLDRHR